MSNTNRNLNHSFTGNYTDENVQCFENDYERIKWKEMNDNAKESNEISDYEDSNFVLKKHFVDEKWDLLDFYNNFYKNQGNSNE